MEEHAKSSTIRDLTQGPLVRQLLLFALPIMGANLLQSLYTLVDLWAVGNFASEAAISAVANSGQIVFLIQNRTLPTHQQHRFPVIQKPHFIRGEKFPSRLLEIHRITSASSFGLPIGIGIQCFFSQ